MSSPLITQTPVIPTENSLENSLGNSLENSLGNSLENSLENSLGNSPENLYNPQTTELMPPPFTIEQSISNNPPEPQVAPESVKSTSEHEQKSIIDYIKNTMKKLNPLNCDEINNIGEDKDIIKHLQHKFEKSLIAIKGSLLVFLTIATAMYHFLYNKVKDAQTLLHLEPSKIFLDATITGILGVITVIFISISRNGFSYFTSISWKNCLLIFVILFMFGLAQEGSGLNRYLDKTELLNDQGLYYKYYLKHGITQKEIDAMEFGGDPFLKTVSYLFILFILLFVFSYVFKIVNTAICAYKSGGTFTKFSKIFAIGISSDSVGLRGFLFTLEALIAIGLNFIPVLISPIIRGEEKKIKITTSTYGLLFIIVMLHLILQVLGML